MMLSSIYNWLSGAGFGDCAWAFEQGMLQGAGSPLMVTGALRGRGQLPIGRPSPDMGCRSAGRPGNRVLADRVTVTHVIKGGDLLPVPGGYGDVPCSFSHAVKTSAPAGGIVPA